MIVVQRTTAGKAHHLKELRTVALHQAHVLINAARSEHLTDLAFQDMIYLRKATQARELLAAVPTPTDLSAYPLITAEIGLTGPDAIAVAQSVLARDADLQGIAAPMETARMTFYRDIEIATDGASIDAALLALKTSLTAIQGSAPVN